MVNCKCKERQQPTVALPAGTSYFNQNNHTVTLKAVLMPKIVILKTEDIQFGLGPAGISIYLVCSARNNNFSKPRSFKELFKTGNILTLHLSIEPPFKDLSYPLVSLSKTQIF